MYLAPHVARTSALTQCLNLVWSSQARAVDLEARNQRLTEDLHRCRAMIGDLKAKLAAAEEALATAKADIEMLKVPLSATPHVSSFCYQCEMMQRELLELYNDAPRERPQARPDKVVTVEVPTEVAIAGPPIRRSPGRDAACQTDAVEVSSEPDRPPDRIRASHPFTLSQLGRLIK